MFISRAPLHQLFDGDDAILVRVYQVKYFFNMIFCGSVVNSGMRRASQHFVNARDDVYHFGFCDEAVSVQIVQAKHPLQLLLDAAPGDF
jgi:hypothetical protein